MNILKPKAFKFKITLDDSKPRIWRRILVPTNYTFWDLHVAIQDAMGWLDYHLHTFNVKDPNTNDSIEIGIDNDEMRLSDTQYFKDHEVKLSEYFIDEKTNAKYIYDFGDYWKHTITFEKIVEIDLGENLPQCISGKRACPPEDCGGVPGYEHMLSVLANPDDSEYEDMLDWLEEDFDTEDFHPKEVVFDDPVERFKELGF